MARKSIEEFDKQMLKNLKDLNGLDKSVIKDVDNYEGYNVVPLDSPPLNYNFGNGGFALGKYYVFEGRESGGKTATALYIMGCIQKNIKYANKKDSDGDLITSGRIALIDFEHSFEKNWYTTCGLDCSKESFKLVQPETAEHGWAIIQEYIVSGLYDGILVDSLNVMETNSQLEKDFDEIEKIGEHANLTGRAYKRFGKLIDKHQVGLIFISQLRSTMNMYSPDTPSGGNATKFYASNRSSFKSGNSAIIFEGSKDKSKAIGCTITLSNIKNKLSVPKRKSEYELIYTKGFNFDKSYIDFAVEYGFIEKAGSWYKYNDENIGQGKEKTYKYLLSNTELFEKLKKFVNTEMYRRDSLIEIIEDEIEEKNNEGT